MNVNDIINLRNDIQFFNEIQKEFNLEVEKLNLNLIQLAVKGRKLYVKQNLDGLYYCNECKGNHYKNPVFNNWTTTKLIKKHAKQLNRITELIH